jgi:hypothetical protein
MLDGSSWRVHQQTSRVPAGMPVLLCLMAAGLWAAVVPPTLARVALSMSCSGVICLASQVVHAGHCPRICLHRSDDPMVVLWRTWYQSMFGTSSNQLAGM